MINLKKNIPSPTFRVDLKKYFGNLKSKKKNLNGG